MTTDTEAGVATPTTLAAGGGVLGAADVSLPQATRSIAATVIKAQVRVFIKMLQMSRCKEAAEGSQCGCGGNPQGRLTAQLLSISSIIFGNYVIGLTKKPCVRLRTWRS